MSDLTISFTDTLVVVTCWCGMNHAVPEDLRDYQLRCHRDGRTVPSIYCPLGHSHAPAGKGEAEKLRERLELERREVGRLAAARDQAEASAKAERAAKTRFKNDRDRDRRRVAHGVCPCCGRSFKQLSRHMAIKHPEFVVEADVQAGAR